MFAIKELYYTLAAAWQAADLRRRLQAWWRNGRNPDGADSPIAATAAVADHAAGRVIVLDLRNSGTRKEGR